jgi:hypothetical protein
MLDAIALADGLAVPFEAECLQRAQDAGRCSRDLARPVEVLDPQQPASAVRPRIQVARRRRIQ